MVDEFQDTNRLQLDVLEALERDNLFAVGDEFQSIYGFRHADVTIFRERRAALGEGARAAADRELPLARGAARRPQLHLRAAVARALRAAAGRQRAAPDDGGELRLFDPGDPGGAVPSVELLVTDSRGWDEDTRLGLDGVETKPHRRAEARALAHRLREEVDGGRPASDIVVLVRATASLRVLEEAIEEQGVPTYVVGGRGYWSQQPVRDGIAYLAALANPLDEEALLGVLASPVLRRRRRRADPARRRRARSAAASGPRCGRRCGGDVAGTAPRRAVARRDLRSRDAAARGRRARAASSPSRASSPTSASTRSGCPSRCCWSGRSRGRATTSRCSRGRAASGGSANLRKLMRLAREYERAEGRDLHGFLAYAATRDFAAAREGEAPLESEGLDAVRLMTIHRAKGLEFPVVLRRRPRAPGRRPHATGC